MESHRKPHSTAISCKADKWFVSITVDTRDAPPMCESQAIVGADLGVNRLAALSDGTRVSIREWTCSECGTHHDRDLNAARNLMKLAVSSTVTACGEEGSGMFQSDRVKPASAKQELNVKTAYA
ncbi:zinc ribbon domain-containing protein [Effusibacillus dendaii]|uniref:zinc ribbon domain-containing protein n=1 Tax=Effusibacillus dendaii TaxID=2743772 RepID=UPI00190DEE17|nr:zinc ribbon domain-containing protein [Effusibacillus dendaii]